MAGLSVSVRPGDGGFLVLGWLARVMISIALVGIMLFDSLVLIRGHVHVENTTQAAADAATSSYETNHDYAAARAAAVQAAEMGQETLPANGFTIVHGDVVVTLDGHVDTLIVGHLPGLRSFATPTATVREAIPAS
jgi:hypothetical protein